MEKNMKLIPALILLLPLQAYATTGGKQGNITIYNTTVIADHGGYNVSEYLPLMDKDNEERRKKVFEERRSTKLVNGHFPVVSEKLKVGRLTPDQAKDLKFEMISQPIFMIGYDRISMDWLKANRGHLAKNKAIGLVVNVRNLAQMEELQAIAGKKVVLQPTPGDSLAEHLKISNYPFYMDHKGVMR
jgi:integrating conjugative element protein (TIGR03765 family)